MDELGMEAVSVRAPNEATEEGGVAGPSPVASEEAQIEELVEKSRADPELSRTILMKTQDPAAKPIVIEIVIKQQQWQAGHSPPPQHGAAVLGRWGRWYASLPHWLRRCIEVIHILTLLAILAVGMDHFWHWGVHAYETMTAPREIGTGEGHDNSKAGPEL